MNIQNLVLDINKKCNQLVTANVGEVNSRLLKISVIDNGVPMDLTGITVYLYAKKPDNTKVFNTVKVEDAKQGIVSAEITSQVLAIEGFVKLTLLLTKDKARLASKIFTLKVDETMVDDEALESSNEFNALTDALKKVNNVDKKADKTYVDTLVSSVANGSPKGVYNTLNALKVAIPKGDNNIYVVTDDGCWYYWNGSAWTNGGIYQSSGIDENSVKGYMIDKSVNSKGNLFDKSTVNVGYIYNQSTGEIYYYQDDHAVSEMIPIAYNIISVNWNSIGYMIAMYDKYERYMGYLTGRGSKTFVLKDDCKYIRINMKTEIIDTFTVVYGEQSNVPSLEYDNGVIEWLTIQKSQLPTISVEDLCEYTGLNRTNLIDAKTLTHNCAVSDDSIVELSGCTVTDYIPIEPYKLKGLQIDYSSILNPPKIPDVSDIIIPEIPSSFLGKTIHSFGDSITYWDSRNSWFDSNYYMVGYVSHIREKLGCTVVNKGVAGNTALQITNRLKTTDLADVYAITYMAGANDIQRGVPIGEIGNKEDTEFDTSTYIGAIKEAIKYVHSNYPKCKMYLLAPLQFRNRDITPYAEAMEKVANMYGIPCLRMDKVVQINKFTDATLTVEGLHPNNEGNKLMADSIIPFLKNH